MRTSDTPIKIAITGAAGQLGKHSHARLKYHHGYEVIAINRGLFNDRDAFAQAIKDVDIVLHLAGVNRGSDIEVETGNLEIAEKLIAACQAISKKPQIIYASSIQIDNESIYGRVKRKVGERLEGFASSNGNLFSSLVLPNLFGDLSRPYYNNFIGTFCDQIVEGKPLTIHNDSKVSLLHYNQVADYIADEIINASEGEIRIEGTVSSVQTVADKLQGFYDLYSNSILPDIRDPFDLRLFNSLRSRMFAKHFPMPLVRHADSRGSFFECVRAENPGQTSFSTTVPGIVRGDHFHFDKIERFIVVSGQALIRVRNIFSEEVYEYDVRGDEPCIIDMPPLHTHNIKNTGSTELLTLFWSHDFFDPKNTDTYSEAV